MRLAFGILFGGYALILLSYTWVWALTAGMSRGWSRERMSRPTKADAKTIVEAMGVWTLIWAVMMLLA